jgi:predicted dinucleotide-binding enzyme
MKIGIVGAGRIGGTLGQLFATAGHEVMLSSRHPEKLGEQAAEIGAKTGTISEAAAYGDVVVFAPPWRTKDEAVAQMAAAAGKVVVDTTNPYTGEGGIEDLGDRSSSEIVARLLPDAKVVKAFNTIYFEHLRSQGQKEEDGRRALPIAGDDSAAKEIVAQLIDEIGYVAFDVGDLSEGRRQQPGTTLYNERMTLDEAKEALGR